jgi:hypothetical protein
MEIEKRYKVRLDSLGPIEDDFAGAARHHGFKGFGKFGVVESMGDDRSDIEACSNHAAHFVPSFEHFPAVDPFEDKSFENDLIPIDRDLIGKNPEQ